MQNNKTIVNFVDFIMTEDFNVKPATAGIGRFHNRLRRNDLARLLSTTLFVSSGVAAPVPITILPLQWACSRLPSIGGSKVRWTLR